MLNHFRFNGCKTTAKNSQCNGWYFSHKVYARIFTPLFRKKSAQRYQLLTDKILTQYAQEKYFALRNAPVLIVMHTDKPSYFNKIDARIAGQQISLARETLGLGFCWAGYHQFFCKLFK